MSVLVTGGAGYIGSHMAHALIEHGETVVILDNLSTGLQRLAPQGATFITETSATAPSSPACWSSTPWTA
jgi:UDP-glucose 4-epimerase